MFTKLKMDGQRWIIPADVAPLEQITTGTLLKLCYRHFQMRMMFWFRLAEWLRAKRVPFFPMFFYHLLRRRYGIELNIDGAIGGGLYIPHPVGMVLNPEKMGDYCSAISNVTIGLRNEYKFPILGSYVFMGTGARVLGGITVGDQAMIGANSVVVKDVPAGGTVVGIPGRVVHVKDMSNA